MSTLDERIGHLIDKVNKLGLLENTIIIFQSDNGYSTEQRAHFGGGSSGIYRGAKRSLFEGGIRVPAIISWEGKIQPGVRDQFAVCADWMPTLAEMCGIDLDAKELDGKSIWPVIEDSRVKDPHKERFCWKQNEMWAARSGKWKLLGNPQDTSSKGIISEGDSLFLANLELDPGEMINFANDRPEIVQQLRNQYKNWLNDLKSE